VSALAVVAYTWLDCLDGKQARRTGTSSPLGQLFDHGCDALSVNLLLANIACSLTISCGWAHALGNLGVRGWGGGVVGGLLAMCGAAASACVLHLPRT
jgi:ethanolaminephosphotransferase